MLTPFMNGLRCAGDDLGSGRRPGLSDRGRMAAGLQADLLLVAGDQTHDIDNTLSIEAV